MATSFENLTKNGVSANLFSNLIRIFELTLPFQYTNPTPITFTNKSKN